MRKSKLNNFLKRSKKKNKKRSRREMPNVWLPCKLSRITKSKRLRDRKNWRPKRSKTLKKSKGKWIILISRWRAALWKRKWGISASKQSWKRWAKLSLIKIKHYKRSKKKSTSKCASPRMRKLIARTRTRSCPRDVSMIKSSSIWTIKLPQKRMKKFSQTLLIESILIWGNRLSKGMMRAERWLKLRKKNLWRITRNFWLKW